MLERERNDKNTVKNIVKRISGKTINGMMEQAWSVYPDFCDESYDIMFRIMRHRLINVTCRSPKSPAEIFRNHKPHDDDLDLTRLITQPADCDP